MTADLLRLRKWPAAWVMLAVWLLLNGLFSYLFPCLSYRSGSAGFSTGGATKAELLSSMLPAQLPVTLVSGTPMFGGATLLILGALAAGSGYSWGTWKTVLTQGRTRLQVARRAERNGSHRHRGDLPGGVRALAATLLRRRDVA